MTGKRFSFSALFLIRLRRRGSTYPRFQCAGSGHTLTRLFHHFLFAKTTLFYPELRSCHPSEVSGFRFLAEPRFSRVDIDSGQTLSEVHIAEFAETSAIDLDGRLGPN